MSENIYESRTAKKQASRLKKGRIAMLLVVILGIAGAVYAIWGGNGQSVTGLMPHINSKINVLVLGVDERDDDVGRSDTTFVVTIDTDAKKVTILSIPRDSRVKIAGHGWDKINHAYAFGGSKLSKASIENLLGIPIDYTVVMNFNGFISIIDAIGGITIDVEKPMKYADPYDDDGGLYIDLQPGVQKMNGKMAIEYVRYRDEEGDIGRVARQQKFLKAVLQEFTNPQLITRLPDIIKQFSTTVRTDMPTNEMLKLIPTISDAVKSGLATEWVSGIPIWIQDVSYWLPDIKELRAKVAQIQGITVDENYRQATELLAIEYQQSVPREIKTADVPPVIQKSLAKDSKVVTKTPLASNKPKVEITQSNEDTLPGSTTIPTTIPTTTNHNPAIPETGDESIHKAATVKP
jgi:LCP family protein required for cell wall assembly